MLVHLAAYNEFLNNNFILLVSSNSKEKNAINSKLINKRVSFFNNNTNQKCYIGILENTFVIHLTGTSGISETTSISRLVIEYISNDILPTPALIIIVGFCWGNPKYTKQGDIVVSSEIYSLNYKKVHENGDNYKAPKFTSDIKLNNDGISTFNNKIKLGTIASSEVLYSSTEKRDEIIKCYPEIIAGEMEGFGCIPTLQTKNIPWLIVKAVSDYGDNAYNMDTQNDMATLAVSQIPTLIQHIRDDNLMNLTLNNNFVDILTGQTLEIHIDNITSDDLNDYLNDNIGLIVEQKLKVYHIETDTNNNFIRFICDLILEVVQNEFKHAKASKVSINFFKTKINIKGFGEKYIFRSLNKLEEGKGGYSAWLAVKNNYINQNKIKYIDEKSKHELSFNFVSDYLKNIIENCKVLIKKSAIGTNLAGKQVITYNKDCKEVFVNDTSIRMTSRRLALANEVKELLEKGLIVYLLVDNEENAHRYKNILNDKIENLKVLIDLK